MVRSQWSCKVISWEELFGRMLRPLCLDIIGFLIHFYKMLMDFTVGPILGQNSTLELGMSRTMRIGMLMIGFLGRLGLVNL